MVSGNYCLQVCNTRSTTMVEENNKGIDGRDKMKTWEGEKYRWLAIHTSYETRLAQDFTAFLRKRRIKCDTTTNRLRRPMAEIIK